MGHVALPCLGGLIVFRDFRLGSDSGAVAFADDDAGGDCSELQAQLTADVLAIFCSDRAFAALNADGSKLGGEGTGSADNQARQARDEDQDLPCTLDSPIT